MTWLSQHDMAETRSELVSLAEDWLSEADPAQQTALAARLEKTATAHQMVLVIRQDGGETGRFGQGAATDQPGLTQALAALDGSGTVSDGTTDLFGAVYSAGGVTYQLEVYSQGVVTDLPHQTEHLAATLLAAAVGMVLAAVLVTNRFLTRFVFRHIQEPLETLAEGVHQLRDGNLTYRIAYDSRDEFQPVCEDFNDMAQRLRASVEQSQREEANRKELLASISHDIRSPLTAIQAYVEGLLDGVADTPEKQRGLSITVEPLPTGCQVLADPIYFHSILTNLLDNSAKYKDKAAGQPGDHHRGGGGARTSASPWTTTAPACPPRPCPGSLTCSTATTPPGRTPTRAAAWAWPSWPRAWSGWAEPSGRKTAPRGGLWMVLRIPQTEGEMDHETHSDR